MTVTREKKLTDILELLATGRATLPVFPTVGGLTPVRLSSYPRPTPGEVVRLLGVLGRSGFAVVEAGEHPTPEALRALAVRLRLGEPFVPPLYRLGHPTREARGVSTLAVSVVQDGAGHPFASAGGQRFHTDGTLQRLGEVPTTILLCQSAAASGGASVLLNSTAAFVDLTRQDRAAALALMAPGVLVRSATINNCPDSTAGPVFDVIGDRLVGRYSVQHTDRWEHAAVSDRQALARAVEFFDAAAQPGSDYYLEFTLRPGQGLVLANDRISHGRTGYRDDPAAPRVMLRGLFCRRPSFPEPVDG